MRLAIANEEISHGDCKKIWHHNIINDDLDKAYEQLKRFIKQAYAI